MPAGASAEEPGSCAPGAASAGELRDRRVRWAARSQGAGALSFRFTSVFLMGWFQKCSHCSRHLRNRIFMYLYWDKT